MKIKFKWQEIDSGKFSTTHRAKVFNGWVVRHREFFENGQGESLSMVFVEDLEHIWEVE